MNHTMTDIELTNEKKEEIRKNLIAKHQELSKEVAEINVEMRDIQPVGSDDADKSVAAEERSLMLSKANHKNIAIKSIQATLKNFDDFGYCNSCGDDIEYKRIVNNPTVLRCITCQELFELQQKQRGL